jgi:hypothetical protein
MNIVPNVPLSSFFCVCGPHAMEVEVDVGSYLTSFEITQSCGVNRQQE